MLIIYFTSCYNGLHLQRMPVISITFIYFLWHLYLQNNCLHRPMMIHRKVNKNNDPIDNAAELNE